MDMEIDRSWTNFEQFAIRVQNELLKREYKLTNPEGSGKSPRTFVAGLKKELTSARRNRRTISLDQLADRVHSLSYYIWCYSPKLNKQVVVPILIDVRISDHNDSMSDKTASNDRALKEAAKDDPKFEHGEVRIEPIMIGDENCKTYRDAYAIALNAIDSLDRKVEYYIQSGEWIDPQEL